MPNIFLTCFLLCIALYIPAVFFLLSHSSCMCVIRNLQLEPLVVFGEAIFCYKLEVLQMYLNLVLWNLAQKG